MSANPVDLKEARFPASGTLREKLRLALGYAVLAPSSHNTQPWHFVLQDDAVLVCADRTRALPVADPFDRELIISCGAALLNLRVALAHFGLAYQITAFPFHADPDVLAEVKIGGDGFLDSALAPLFAAIRKRTTNRSDFADEPVPEALRDELRRAAAAEGVALTAVWSERNRDEVADLVAEGDRLQFADPRFRRELAAWMHSSHRKDGLPAYSQGVSELLDFATPAVSAVVRTFDVGGGVAATHRRLAQGSPLLVCLSTASDDAAAWLATGQALERVLLVAAGAFFDASYLNQPIEHAALRPRLKGLMGGDAFPQILLRIGTGAAPKHSPRRSLDEVLW